VLEGKDGDHTTHHPPDTEGEVQHRAVMQYAVDRDNKEGKNPFYFFAQGLV